MSDEYHPPRWWVEASNIHFGTSERFGPYDGIPILTYENLRVASDKIDPPNEIFIWIDPQDVGEGNPHGYDSWTGEDDDIRYFGWRKVERRQHPNNPQLSYAAPVGTFYTDLAIIWDRDRG